MEVTLEKKSFLRGLEVGGKLAGKSKTMPILDCVKIKISNESIIVVSTDSENAISKRIMAITGIDEEFSFCVNCKDLLSYVKLVNSDTLSLVFDDKSLIVKHQKGKTRLPMYDVDEFPEIKGDEEYNSVEIPSSLMSEWISNGKKFISNDSLRPVFASIYFYCKENELGACSTDRFSLFWDKVSQECTDFDFMLRSTAFDAVCETLQDVENVKIKIGETSIKFYGDGICVQTRRQELRFPNFKAVIPSNNNIKVYAEKDEMISALKRCKLSVSSSNGAKLVINGMNLEIHCEDIDFSKKSFESMMVEGNGNITIGLNAEALMTILCSIGTQRVEMSFSDPSRAVVFKEESDSNKILLLNPMII